ncbi:hypothetical protein HKBW3S47_00601, partial [Candidatus Hakubella thermalkaliphila]
KIKKAMGKEAVEGESGGIKKIR